MSNIGLAACSWSGFCLMFVFLDLGWFWLGIHTGLLMRGFALLCNFERVDFCSGVICGPISLTGRMLVGFFVWNSGFYLRDCAIVG